MQWWAWITIGAILLGSELAFVDAQFYLVFLGAAALMVGGLKMLGVLYAEWVEWLLFAAIAAISLLTFRKKIYEQMRRKLPQMNAGPAGECVTLADGLSPGQSCRLEYRGSSWSVVNGSQAPIAAGAKARIDRVEGLTLVVHGER